MRQKATSILWVVLFSAFTVCAWGENTSKPNSTTADVISTDIVTISVEHQYDAVRPGSKSALAVHFELAKNWHFYASPQTAPTGYNLKLKPSGQNYITFSKAIYPQQQPYFDKALGKNLEVFSDKFTIFLPFSVGHPRIAGAYTSINVKITIEGALCSDIQCRMPDFGELSTKIKVAPDAAMSQPKFTLPDLTKAPPASQAPPDHQTSYSVWFALGLAFLAGLTLNIMPCVWPVLPLIVMRIVEQAKQSKGKSTAMGLTFCFGILLFFACLAGANIILQVFYGTVLQWGDQFRNPAFVAAMALLLVVLALFMFGVFTISVPSSISGKAGSGKGYTGAVGMGFLAAILSTPCSFAILAAACAWAQAQPLPLGTLAIMVIGAGMAVPYAILTSTPGLLNRLPKAGRWMELFKQTVGFILLIIAVKLVAALPEARIVRVLYFAVVLSFCVWMWSGWVDYNTKLSRKWLIRIIAAGLAVAAGWMFLPAPAGQLIDWQHYDAELIKTAQAQGRPVLIKFTAKWCLNCVVVDKFVYQRKDIAQLIEEKGVLAIKADTTEKDNRASLDFKNVYNELSLPVSMLFLPGGKEPVKWRGVLFVNKLEKSLKGLADRKQDGKKAEDKGQ